MCNLLDASFLAWRDVSLSDIALVAEVSRAAMLPHPMRVKPIRPALTIIFTEQKNIFMTTP